jgi:2-hydroxyisobutanoyl-CoA mutase small subunit
LRRTRVGCRDTLTQIQVDKHRSIEYRIQYAMYRACAGFPRATPGGSPVEHSSQPIRVVIAKVGLDGHDRGVKIVARTLRDAGMDVVYTGLHRTPEEVVEAAIQEDVDVIGVSILSGAHMTVFPRLINLLKERDAEDILVVGGGVIPDEDLPKLKAMGVRELLLQDTPPREIVETIRRLVAERGPR